MSNSTVKHASLFSGMGGFDYAAQMIGWKNVFHCEINKILQDLLKFYWPESVSYGNIKDTDFSVWRGRVDVLTGGFPCQPYSTAGKRLGKDDERHLWPEMLRAIREISPIWVVGENVRGIVNWNRGVVFDEVQSDLEAQGYEVLPFILPAAGVNAPHERYRVWFIAYLSNTRTESVRQTWKNNLFESWFATNSNNQHGDRTGFCTGQIPQHKSPFIQNRETFENPFSNGRIQREPEQEGAENGQLGNTCTGNSKWVCRKKMAGAITNADGLRLRRKDNREGKPGFSCENGQRTNWSNFPTESPIYTGNDGIPTDILRQRIREDCMGLLSEKEIDKIISKALVTWRKESIKAAGNAVVWQIPFEIFRVIDQMNN
jgi:DNA (cytosine-5)-methyltransferase 1